LSRKERGRAILEKKVSPGGDFKRENGKGVMFRGEEESQESPDGNNEQSLKSRGRAELQPQKA